MTIVFWFKADDFGVHDARFVSKATGVNEQDHDWMVSTLNSTQLRFRLKTNGTTSTHIVTPAALNLNTWYHVAAVYDGSAMSIYLDGAQVGDSTAKTGAITNGNANVALGNQSDGDDDKAFDGLLDEVCLYDKALSVAEISGIMSTGCVGSGNPSTPTATPTNTPQPGATNTPTPTATATASPTPAPTNEVTKIQRTYYSIAGQAVGVRVKKVRINGSTESDDMYYMYTDHLGNVGALSDKNGNYITNSLTLFRPFGNFRREPSTNPSVTDRGYTGHVHNNTGSNDLGLIYMRARYFLPNTNRFLTPDTIVPDPTNPQSLNRYSYVNNNPIRFSDPTGHCINGGNDGANGGTGIDDVYYDCSITPPSSTNPIGETMHVNGILRILAMLEGTQYIGMDIYGAALWWNAIYVRVNPFIAPVNDENGDFVYPGFHEDQLAALRNAYNPGQLESMARYPRNNELDQFELGSAEGVEIAYLNTLLGIQGGPQFSTEILRELGLDFDPNDHASNFEPNYLNAVYAYHPEAVNQVIKTELIIQLDIGLSPSDYRGLTNLPSDLFSTE